MTYSTNLIMVVTEHLIFFNEYTSNSSTSKFIPITINFDHYYWRSIKEKNQRKIKDVSVQSKLNSKSFLIVYLF